MQKKLPQCTIWHQLPVNEFMNLVIISNDKIKCDYDNLKLAECNLISVHKKEENKSTAAV